MTFRVDGRVLGSARRAAWRRHRTLNDEFLVWIEKYVSKGRAEEAMRVIDVIASYTGTGGRKFTREEMNERRPAIGDTEV